MELSDDEILLNTCTAHVSIENDTNYRGGILRFLKFKTAVFKILNFYPKKCNLATTLGPFFAIHAIYGVVYLFIMK
jgi:hypothetical protein